MRQTQIFAGSSHPVLVEAICERLGSNPAKAELGKFSNGETQVNLHTSIREQDVFIVQSGSNKINDNVMELLIMISACKSGSARSITAVMPYFPYSRSSKKKSHRGAITARMLANLLHVAGVDHVITIDLHASQMQGFFRCPVDNLRAEPLLANWIKHNIPEWKRAVVVSKNPGGTKRVTSLADVLKLDFGIMMTDRRRPGSGDISRNQSMIFNSPARHWPNGSHEDHTYHSADDEADEDSPKQNGHATPRRRHLNGSNRTSLSPLQQTMNASSPSGGIARVQTAPSAMRDQYDGSADEDDEDNYVDPRSRDVVTGRLVHGHIVDDNDPSPAHSATTASAHFSNLHDDHDGASSATGGPTEDPMLSSIYSTASSATHLRLPPEALGGSADAIASSDDEEEKLLDPAFESTVTLVGNVRDRPVLIVDDMIDKSASWIAAAETVVKRGGATGVWCVATHGIFDGGKSLLEMQACEFIHRIVVTNSCPITLPSFGASAGPAGGSGGGNTGTAIADGLGTKTVGKLTVLDVSWLLAEAIRRNRHGESISQLLMYSGI